MKKTKITNNKLFFIVLLLYCYIINSKEYLLIKKPIANLFIMNNAAKWKDKPLGYSPLQTSVQVPRIAQALYNEILEIIKKEMGQYCIKHPYYYYCDKNGNLINEFWVDESAGDVINDDHCLLVVNHFLDALSVKEYAYDQNIVTLIEPFEHDGIIYSIGTRFYFNYHAHNKHLITITINGKQVTINKKICLFDHFIHHIKKIKNNELLSRKIFIEFLTYIIKLFEKQQEFIPYVWGGSSLAGIPSTSTTVSNEKDGWWDWKNSHEEVLTSPREYGVDCSTLVALCARIIGLPFYVRNTTAQKKYLKKSDTIQNGDLLWINRHVFILCMIKDNYYVIEASGYETGFKQVTIKALQERFKNINTFDDLMDLKKNNNPLILIRPDGSESVHKEFEFLDLMSCVKINYQLQVLKK